MIDPLYYTSIVLPFVFEEGLMAVVIMYAALDTPNPVFNYSIQRLPGSKVEVYN